jgi:hypothetical protein
MKNVNVRFPEGVHEALSDYRERHKPHMSINALIVDAVDRFVERHEAAQSGSTQIDTEALDRMKAKHPADTFDGREGA